MVSRFTDSMFPIVQRTFGLRLQAPQFWKQRRRRDVTRQYKTFPYSPRQIAFECRTQPATGWAFHHTVMLSLDELPNGQGDVQLYPSRLMRLGLVLNLSLRSYTKHVAGGTKFPN